MKKVLLGMLTLILLCGCGESTSNNKVCELEVDGEKSIYSAYSKDGVNIDTIEYKHIIEEENFSKNGFGETIEENEAFISMFNNIMDSLERDGVKFDVFMENNTIVSITSVDYNLIDIDELKNVSVNFGEDKTIESFMKYVQSVGAVCK